MIVFRRVLAVVLAFFFIVLFIPWLAVDRANVTASSPEFYVDQLRQADVYNFVYDEAIPAAMEELDIGRESSFDIVALKPHIVDIVEQTIPPEWLQEHVEQAIHQVIPYILGNTDSFVITITIEDRIRLATQALKNTLHHDDVTEVMYEQLVELILEQAASDLGDLPPGLNQKNLEVLLRAALPPETLLIHIDELIDAIKSYLTGDTAQFSIRIDLSEDLEAIETLVTSILQSQEIYGYLFEDLVSSAIQKNIQELTTLPLGIEITQAEVITTAKNALTLEWYQSQVAGMVEQTVPYVAGTRDTLEVTIALGDRRPALASALANLAERKLDELPNTLPQCTPAQKEAIISDTPLYILPECWPAGLSYEQFIVTGYLNTQNTYGLFFDNIISAAIEESLQDVTQLSIGVELTQEESVTAARQILTLEWYQSHVASITEQALPYLTGEQPTFAVSMSLTDQRPAVVAILNELADQKLESAFDSLPACTPAGLLAFESNPPVGILPDCRPPSTSYHELKDLLGIDIASEVAPLLESSMSDEWTITEADLEQALGSELADFLGADIRSLVASSLATSLPDDWTLTEADLNRMVGGEGQENVLAEITDLLQEGFVIDEEQVQDFMGTESAILDDIRAYSTTGFTFTEEDLRQRLEDAGENVLVGILENVRSEIRLWRWMIGAAWLIPILFLAAVGVLGGRQWRNKLIWAAAPLSVATIIMLIIPGVLFSSLAQPQIDSLADTTTREQGLSALGTEKVLDIAENASAAFLGGIRTQAIIMLVISLVLIALGIAWRIREQRRGAEP